MDLDAIEHAAQAATSGEWRWDRETGTLDSLQDECSHVVTVACAENGRIDIDSVDAEFMVTCQPAVALAMAAEIRRLRAELKEALDGWELLIDDAHNEHATRDNPNPCAAERARIAELRRLVET